LVDLENELFLEVPARDARLVRHDRDGHSGLVQPPDRLGASRQERAAREVVHVADLFADRAVAIEKDAGNPPARWSAAHRPRMLSHGVAPPLGDAGGAGGAPTPG